MNLKIQIIWLLLLLLCACGTPVEPISIQEKPYVEADIDSEFWDAKDFTLSENQQVVHPLNDQQLLTRLTLSAYDQNQQISFSIEIANKDNAVGRYEKRYRANGGLAEMSLFIKKGNAYQVYVLDAKDTLSNVRIRRHSAGRAIMSGTFEGVLFNRAKPSERLVISNGTFSNLNYKK